MTPEAGGTRGYRDPGVDAVCPGELAKPLGPRSVWCRSEHLSLTPSVREQRCGHKLAWREEEEPLADALRPGPGRRTPLPLLPPAKVAGARVDLLSGGCGRLGLWPGSEGQVVTGQTLGAGGALTLRNSLYCVTCWTAKRNRNVESEFPASPSQADTLIFYQRLSLQFMAYWI